MPSPEDLKRISGAISSDPQRFSAASFFILKKSVKECYDKNNEVSPCQATLPHLDNRIESRIARHPRKVIRRWQKRK